MLLGCIADDVTGASDLAALLARSGLAVELHLGLPQQPDSGAPLQVIALKCRTLPVQAAVAECRAALAWLRAAGAQRFYWKYCSTFDSTPVGNIGPVAEALMRDLGVGQTLYCPAFPENGRAIFMGNLFVGDEPLAESPMKDHPLTPMRDSNLLRLLAPQVLGKVGLANRLVVARGAAALAGRLAELRADGVAHVVVDAVANEDLAVIAEAARDMALITGGSAGVLSGLFGVGGGIVMTPGLTALAGMAPILSVLRALAEKGSTRKATFYYGARRRRDLCFEKELQALEEQLPNFRYVPALSDADGEPWEGEVGLITDVVKRHEQDLSEMDSYVCGPPLMVEAAMEVLSVLGAPDKRVYYDKFTTTGSS